MKKKLAALLAAAMVVAMIPVTSFAATDNRISRQATGTVDTVINTNIPVITIEKKDLVGVTTPVVFELDLVNAEWDLAQFGGVALGVPTSTVPTGFVGTAPSVTFLTATKAIVTATPVSDQIVVPLATVLKTEGAATVTVDALESKVSEGTYQFANVVAGDVTVSVEKTTDVVEGGTVIKPVVITETAAGSLKVGAGQLITLKLPNGFSFKNTDNDTNVKVTCYPAGEVALSAATTADPLFIDVNDETMTLRVDVTGSQVAKIITITGLKVGFDEDDVTPGDVADITISGADISKVSIDAAVARTYGVKFTAENKTVPTFIAGRDAEDPTLKVTLEEVISASWLENRKTTITFPEGVKVKSVTASDKTNLTSITCTPDGNVVTLDATKTSISTKTKVKFTFDLTIAADFAGDITATLGGAGVEEDITVVVAKAIAPVTVEAESNEVSIDYRNVAVTDIIVKENVTGALEKDQTFYIELENIAFDGKPVVEVVEGDIKIDSVKVTGGLIEIKVKTATQKTPAVLKITNLDLYLQRNIPAGKYALSLVANGKDNTIFQNYDKDAKKADPKFKVDEVVVLEDYVEVVTAGRDQDDSTFTTQIVVTIGADTMMAGKEVIPLDVPAYISNGYTMLPVRAVTEALSGAAIVRWDDATKTVTITFGARVISMTVGSKTMNINGVEVAMQAKCEITNSRAFIPLRDLGYALGLNDSKINWDAATNTATLN